VKPNKVISANISIRINIAHTKKGPTQVQKPFAMTLEFPQESRESPHEVEIPLLKQAAESFVPGLNERYYFAADKSMSSPFEKYVTPWRKDDQSSFRSELGGIYAMVVAIELICKFFTYPMDQCLLEVTVKRLCTKSLIKAKKPHHQQIILI
jgi:hypothetical protein